MNDETERLTSALEAAANALNIAGCRAVEKGADAHAHGVPNINLGQFKRLVENGLRQAANALGKDATDYEFISSYCRK